MIGALLWEVGDIPELRGALCRYHLTTFDAAIGEGSGPSLSVRRARETARDICEACPVLDRCGDWVEATMPSRRPVGVVAGEYVDHSGRFPRDRARKRHSSGRGAQ